MKYMSERKMTDQRNFIREEKHLGVQTDWVNEYIESYLASLGTKQPVVLTEFLDIDEIWQPSCLLSTVKSSVPSTTAQVDGVLAKNKGTLHKSREPIAIFPGTYLASAIFVVSPLTPC